MRVCWVRGAETEQNKAFIMLIAELVLVGQNSTLQTFAFSYLQLVNRYLCLDRTLIKEA